VNNKTAKDEKATHLVIGAQSKVSPDILYHAMEKTPDIAAPNKPPIKETEKTFIIGLRKVLKIKRLLRWIQLAPDQMQNESSIKYKLTAINSK